MMVRKITLLLCLLVFMSKAVNAQLITTYTPNEVCQSGYNVKAFINKVTLYSNYTLIEIGLKPQRYLDRLECYTSALTYLLAGNKRLKYLGALSDDNKTYHSINHSDRYGWSNISPSYTYYYTLVFSDSPDPGVTSISLIDPVTYYPGYTFKDIKIDNPSHLAEPVPDNDDDGEDDVSNINWEKYLAYTNQSVNLRSESNTNSDVVKVLPKNSLLFIDKDEEENGFYKALDIESNLEGYVSKNYVTFGQKVKRSSGNMIHGQHGISSYGPPEVTVNNNNYTHMKLKVGDSEYQFNPYEKKKIAVSSGTHTFLASSPGIIPLAGTKTFKQGWDYDWVFTVVDHYGSTKSNKQNRGFKKNNSGRVYKRR